jgi:uncharacterized protein (TIGR02996 family)
MTERDALLRAILCEPTDDTVRLVYADWLDENGEPERAEFVRVQVELAKLDCSEPDCERYADQKGCGCDECSRWRKNWSVKARQRELWAALSGTWERHQRLDPLAAIGLFGENFHGVTPVGVVSRGFVSSLTCDQSLFLAHARDIFAAHPVLTVTLSDREPYQNGAGYCWFDAERDRRGHVPQEAELARRIFEMLVPHPGGKGRVRWRDYPTRDLARSALSDAAVFHARSLADLPPLPAPLPATA